MFNPTAEKMSQRTVTIVFGSRGLLGSRCMRELSSTGRWVIGVSSNGIVDSTGHTVAVPAASRSGLNTLWKLVGDATIESLILVASAGPDSKPEEFHMEVNSTYEAFIKRLESTWRQPRSIVFASSSLLSDGEARGGEARAERAQPASAYLRSKLDFEQFLRDLASQFTESSITALRLGPIVSRDVPTNRDNLIADIIRALHDGTPLNLRGGGRAVRGFLHLEDAVAAIVSALEHKLSGFRVRLVEGPAQVSVGEFVTKVSQLTGLRVNAPFGNPLSPVATQVSPTTDSELSLENWRPKFSIERMITDSFGGFNSPD
jgi:UDP-glucuronate 4-epimerase